MFIKLTKFNFDSKNPVHKSHRQVLVNLNSIRQIQEVKEEDGSAGICVTWNDGNQMEFDDNYQQIVNQIQDNNLIIIEKIHG